MMFIIGEGFAEVQILNGVELALLVELLMSQKYAALATFCLLWFTYIKMFVSPSRVTKWFLRFFS